MTDTSKEILERYQIRKTRKQKEAFRKWLLPILEDAGYSVTIEKGSLGSRNIVIGDVSRAQVVYTAHYDTCPVLPVPNLITPKSLPLYLLYQVVLTIGIIAAVVCFSVAAGTVGYLIHEDLMLPFTLVGCYAPLVLMLFGPANRHTANDNTSGVTAVLDLALAMPEQLREKAAFVLFDLEEAGLIGSQSFARQHKKVMTGKLLVNLDCVSDGDTMLFCFRKRAVQDVARFQAAFPADENVTPDFATKGYIYPSDQMHFARGVGVAALNRTRGGILYMDKIHTKKDTVYREENIRYLVDGCIRLTEMI